MATFLDKLLAPASVPLWVLAGVAFLGRSFGMAAGFWLAWCGRISS